MANINNKQADKKITIMNWSVATISQFEPLKWYEYLAVYLRRRSNMRSCYLRCAYAEYDNLSVTEKTQLARDITGDMTLYNSDITTQELVLTCWDKMTDEQKMAWRERAEFINSLPTYGEYYELPERPGLRTDEERSNLIRLSLKKESDFLRKEITSSLQLLSNCQSTKDRVIAFPQKVKVENMSFVWTKMSPLFSDILFGRLLSGIPSSENKTTSSGAKNMYIHVASPVRLDELMSMDEVHFCKYYNFRTKLNYALTSLAVVKDQSGCESKAYGWRESENTITFVHNHFRAGENEPASLTTFPRPYFEIKKVSTKRRKERKYVTTNLPIVDGLQLVEYTPVSMCTCPTKLKYAHVGAKLCYSNVPEEQNNDTIIIRENLST